MEVPHSKDKKHRGSKIDIQIHKNPVKKKAVEGRPISRIEFSIAALPVGGAFFYFIGFLIY